jgi:hypothetical protein
MVSRITRPSESLVNCAISIFAFTRDVPALAERGEDDRGNLHRGSRLRDCGGSHGERRGSVKVIYRDGIFGIILRMDTKKQLLDKLIGLKLDLIAHIDVFRGSRVSDGYGNHVDWRKAVAEARKGLNSNQAADLYSGVSERILAAKPGSEEELLALIALLDQKTPMETL